MDSDTVAELTWSLLFKCGGGNIAS